MTGDKAALYGFTDGVKHGVYKSSHFKVTGFLLYLEALCNIESSRGRERGRERCTRDKQKVTSLCIDLHRVTSYESDSVCFHLH